MKGHVYKRCPCGVLRDDQGKRLTCPKRHGSWYIVYNRPPDIHGRRRQVTKGGFATERAASAALHDALTVAWRGDYVEPVKLTVGEYLEQWLAPRPACGRTRDGRTAAISTGTSSRRSAISS